MKRQLKDLGKSMLGSLHRAGLPLGLTILPNHYYTPIADQRRLAATQAHWKPRAELRGIDLDVARQTAWLAEKVAPFEPEYRGNVNFKRGMSDGFGPGYGYIEAQCLHGVVRALKPPRVVEIGSGVSTYCTLAALAKNAEEGAPGRVTCIEPYPSDFLTRNTGIELIKSPVEQLDPAWFDQLVAGDLLFIDSTHAVRPGGDVAYLFLSVLPRLKPGIYIHIHDIYLPYLYQRDVLDSLFQANETMLLAALMTGNPHLRMLAALSQLHYDAPEALKQVFPEYDRHPGDEGLAIGKTGHFPSSAWLVTA